MQSPRRTPRQWQSIIKSFQASGLSGSAFCQREGIHPKSFYRAKSIHGELKSPNKFIQAAPPSFSTDQITIILPNARIVCSASICVKWIADLLGTISR